MEKVEIGDWVRYITHSTWSGRVFYRIGIVTDVDGDGDLIIENTQRLLKGDVLEVRTKGTP